MQCPQWSTDPKWQFPRAQYTKGHACLPSCRQGIDSKPVFPLVINAHHGRKYARSCDENVSKISQNAPPRPPPCLSVKLIVSSGTRWRVESRTQTLSAVDHTMLFSGDAHPLPSDPHTSMLPLSSWPVDGMNERIGERHKREKCTLVTPNALRMSRVLPGCRPWPSIHASRAKFAVS